MDKENKKNSRLGIILAIVVLLLIGVIVALLLLLKKSSDEKNSDEVTSVATPSIGAIAYESNVVTTDEETLQKLYDEMVEQAKEGTMALEMKTEAVSSDGTNFNCFIGNAYNNKYDMFVVIYRDDTQEEIYRSGLIPLGARIETFVSNVKFEPGDYVGTIVYNQVEDDQATIHSQVNVGLQLIVK